MIYKRTPDEGRIRAALGSMPYGGTVRALREASSRVGLCNGVPTPIELRDVATYLEAMVKYLETAVAEEQRQAAELRQLRADVEAVRRVFGVVTPQVINDAEDE